MSANIEHKATIEHIGNDYVDLVMTVEEACAACKAKNVCGMDDSGRKKLSIQIEDPQEFSVGEEVTVSIEQVAGVKSVVVAYVVPCVAMLLTLFILREFGVKEVVAGLSSLGVVVIYYFIIRIFFRNKIEKEIIFNLRKS